LQNLTVDGDGAANNAQNDEDGNEYASGPQPFVQSQADKKAKDNATGHRQADLHDDGKVFGPDAIFFVIKYHTSVSKNFRLTQQQNLCKQFPVFQMA
jgi:hypothetical protein